MIGPIDVRRLHDQCFVFAEEFSDRAVDPVRIDFGGFGAFRPRKDSDFLGRRSEVGRRSR